MAEDAVRLPVSAMPTLSLLSLSADDDAAQHGIVVAGLERGRRPGVDVYSLELIRRGKLRDAKDCTERWSGSATSERVRRTKESGLTVVDLLRVCRVKKKSQLRLPRGIR